MSTQNVREVRMAVRCFRSEPSIRVSGKRNDLFTMNSPRKRITSSKWSSLDALEAHACEQLVSCYPSHVHSEFRRNLPRPAKISDIIS